MKNYDQSAEINDNPNWSFVPDHPHRILIIGGLGHAKLLLNLIKRKWPDIEKIYLYFKDPFILKFQLLIHGTEKVGIKDLKNPKAFIDYSQTTDDVHENLEDYNPTKKSVKNSEKNSAGRYES